MTTHSSPGSFFIVSYFFLFRWHIAVIIILKRWVTAFAKNAFVSPIMHRPPLNTSYIYFSPLTHSLSLFLFFSLIVCLCSRFNNGIVYDNLIMSTFTVRVVTHWYSIYNFTNEHVVLVIKGWNFSVVYTQIITI